MPGNTAENCEHANAAPRATIEALPESQAGAGRHKCAVCAYRAGFLEAMGRVEGILPKLGVYLCEHGYISGWDECEECAAEDAAWDNNEEGQS